MTMAYVDSDSLRYALIILDHQGRPSYGIVKAVAPLFVFIIEPNGRVVIDYFLAEKTQTHYENSQSEPLNVFSTSII